jgi:hypothetical protein
MENSKQPTGAWDQSFSNAVKQACERAILNLFPEVQDAAARRMLAQGFLAGVEWCFSEQSDSDIAKATLAVGLCPAEAVNGAIRNVL